MSQLHTIFNVLPNSEIAKIKKIRIIGKEREIFDSINSYRHKEFPQISTICDSAKITQSHFYKICSILLDKIYECLIPEKGVKLLQYLIGKGLYNHFKHEAMMQEKLLLAENASDKTLENFYLNCFKLSQKASAKDLDEKLVQNYGEKYLKYKKPIDKDDKYYVKLSLLSTVLYVLKATKKDIERAKSIGKELLGDELKLADSSNVLTKYELYKSLSTYYQHTEGDAANAKKYIEKNVSLINSNLSYFEKDEQILVKCKQAEINYMNSAFDTAYNLYTQIFTEFQHELENDFYHHSKYIQLAILTKNYSIAKDVLNNHFGVYLESKQGPQALMASISYAKLYLFTDISQANKYIQQAKKLISKSYYVQYELEIRILENIYFILVNDIKTSTSLVKKNIKFMNSRGMNLKNSEMIFVMIILQNLLKPNFHLKGLSPRLEKKLHFLQSSYAAIFGELIKKCIQSFSINN
jgi:hypothetical protein